MRAPNDASPRSLHLRFLGTGCLLAAAFVITHEPRFLEQEHLTIPLQSIPARIDGWTQTGDETLAGDVLEKLKPTSYLLRSYSKEGSPLGLFVVFYAAQRNGDAVHSPKHCFPGSGWEIWRKELLPLPAARTNFEVNHYSISNAGQKLAVLYWYQSRKRIIANEYNGKLLLMKDALLEGHTSGALVRITMPDQPGYPQKAITFASEIQAAVNRCLNGSL